jgi:hypothetical protein
MACAEGGMSVDWHCWREGHIECPRLVWLAAIQGSSYTSTACQDGDNRSAEAMRGDVRWLFRVIKSWSGARQRCHDDPELLHAVLLIPIEQESMAMGDFRFLVCLTEVNGYHRGHQSPKTVEQVPVQEQMATVTAWWVERRSSTLHSRFRHDNIGVPFRQAHLHLLPPRPG